jgi:hypothetical protein
MLPQVFYLKMKVAALVVTTEAGVGSPGKEGQSQGRTNRTSPRDRRRASRPHWAE